MAHSPEKDYFGPKSFTSNKASCLSKMPEVIKGLLIPSGHSLILQKAARSCTFSKSGTLRGILFFPKYDEDDDTTVQTDDDTTIQMDLGRMIV